MEILITEVQEQNHTSCSHFPKQLRLDSQFSNPFTLKPKHPVTPGTFCVGFAYSPCPLGPLPRWRPIWIWTISKSSWSWYLLVNTICKGFKVEVKLQGTVTRWKIFILFLLKKQQVFVAVHIILKIRKRSRYYFTCRINIKQLLSTIYRS